MRTFYLLIAIGLGLAPSAAFALDFQLRCEGVSSRVEGRSASAWVHNSNGDSAYGNVYGNTLANHDDVMRVVAEGEDIRFQLPKRMLPPANGGGDGGWWRLERPVVTDTEITGRISLNMINKPKVRLDRISGDLNIDGMASTGFHGRCAVEERDVENRKF